MSALLYYPAQMTPDLLKCFPSALQHVYLLKIDSTADSTGDVGVRCVLPRFGDATVPAGLLFVPRGFD
eukprot:scaffold128798_cov40-Tisochrysis_lutea.AAC.3